MNCLKRKTKSRKTVATNSGVPAHSCCCCCQATCKYPHFITGVSEAAKKIPDNDFQSQQHSKEDGLSNSKTRGTVRITDDEPNSCYRFLTRTLSNDNVQGAETVQDNDYSGPGPQEIAYMPVSKDDPYYNMNHLRRGKAAIFNFDHWDNTMIPDLGLSPRQGSAKDKNDLSQTLKNLDFEVETYESCDSLEMWKILQRLRDEDHSDADCLVVAIMTHGERNTVFVRDGTQIPVNLIWETFEANQCPTLAGKPKIFIIQACRGKRYDSGTMLTNSKQIVVEQVMDVTDSAAFSYVIPNSADFLIAFSCPLGHYSWRNPQLGSWFIQSICKIFDKDAYSMDLQSLFTEVARDVALNYESNTTHYASDKKKQATSTSSTLIRKVVFKPKFRSAAVPLLNGNIHVDIEDLRIVPISTEYLTESRL